MKIKVQVTRSTDPRCAVGAIGRATLYASYNGVRSDSVQFFFPGACKDQDHLTTAAKSTTRFPRCSRPQRGARGSR
jgi:hypothetical protein